MRKIILLTGLFFSFLISLPAQIINGLDTLYGNEWINFDQDYFKIMLAEDGIYELPYQALADAGVPLSQIEGADFQMFHNGEEIPIYTTTGGILGTDDRIEFFGKKNTSELDRYLFKNPEEEMMNPRYSLFTDTSAYFLTWTDIGTPLRYQTIDNDLTNLPAKEEYFMAEQVLNFFNQHQKEGNSQGVRLSSFTMGEGFASNAVNVQTHTLTPEEPFVGGPDANLYIRYSGRYGEHEQLITLNGATLATDVFNNFEVRNLNFPISNAQLNEALSIKFEGLAGSADRQRVANIVLTYPQKYEAGNSQTFRFDQSPSGTKKYIEVEGLNGSNLAVLYDVKNAIRIPVQMDNTLAKIAIPPSASERDMFLVNNNSGLKFPASIKPISFINYSELDANFIFLSNPKLYDDGNGNNYVQEYADYRASSEGGGFNPIIVDVQQVYEQFGWGLNRHALSIRNFAHYIKKEWEDVEYFFIVGKGREYPSVRTAGQLGSANSATFYVPTFGVPGSDNQLLAGEDGFTPIVPVGRLAVSTVDNIRVYLEKVKLFEANRNLPQTIEERAWMKKILHLGGGATAGEQSSIRNYLANMEGIITQNKFGGSVKSFYKTSTDPIQVSQTEQIFDYINDGLSLISFFGHSAVGAFDFSIDNPDNYENYGKYPLIISLGCYSGNIHTGSQGVSERFTFFENKGAIAFAATSGQGYISSLHTICSEFYNQIGDEIYGQGIGDALQKTISHFQSAGFGVNLIRQQFNFNGDPSLSLNPAPGPDYTVDATTVAFSPEVLTTELKEIDLSFDVVNLGKYIHDSILITIEQELPDGTRLELLRQKRPAPAFSENMTFTLPSQGKAALGFNRFFVKLDAEDDVEELPLPQAESNNELVVNGTPGIQVYITNNSAQAVYPPEFAIVSSPGVELKATTSDLLIPERTYIMEIDTTELFNSPLKLSKNITQPGGVIRWQPPVDWQDNTVYYWRISPDSISPQQGFIWDYSSFVYLENSGGGWNQSHFYQYKKDEFVNMELPGPDGLKFLDDFKDVFIREAVNSVELTRFFINNGFAGRYWNAPDAGIYVTVFDSTTVRKWTNSGPPYLYGLPNPYGYWTASYLFETVTQGGRQELIDFLENVVPNGNYVFLFTVQKNLSNDYMPQDWESDQPVLGTDLFQVLEAQGANLIRNTLDVGAIPYVFTYKKGEGPIVEALADSLTDIVEVNFSLPGYWDRGEVKSTPIGPARSWKSLQWDIYSHSLPEADTVSLDVFATDPITQRDTLLLAGLLTGEADLSFIDAKEYPYLKLKFNSEDSLYRTSAQLKYWRVLYDGFPDFAINPAGYYSLQSDTLPQGKPLHLGFLVENISDNAGDSLLIRYSVSDAANNELFTSDREKPMVANDTLLANFQTDTRLLSGMHRLSAELNPANDQPELSHINNVLNTTFFVTKDERNPLLDVTFDGQHILDGDLVSAHPLVRIELEDENDYLALADTSLFRVFLVYPDSSETLQRVYFSDPAISFFPATANAGNTNQAAIELRRNFSKDGTYQLIVQAQDVTGNASGQYDYKVSFKVITKSSISDFLNYPNPFTTSTRFLYTLTGSEPPAKYNVQIMTVSGRIVRTLTQDEIGPLQVGTHLTDYAWDGSDEYGARLAKGVYLYRVVVEDENGKEWEKYETGAEAFLKNGYGKMVLLR